MCQSPWKHSIRKQCSEFPSLSGRAWNLIPLYEAVATLLKGPEIDLVQYGQRPYIDHGGKARTQARLRRWDADARTLRTLAELSGAPHTRDVVAETPSG